MTKEFLQTASIVVGVGITAISALSAAVTYRCAERRRRKEFVTAEYRRLKANEGIRRVLALLDGAGVDVEIGGKSLGMLQYNELFNAMRLHVSDDDKFEPWEAAVREHFDNFFEELIAFAQFIEVGLAKPSDLAPYLRHWVGLICGEAWMSKRDAQMLWDYIDYYGFPGVRTLATRLGCLPPPMRVKMFTRPQTEGDQSTIS